MIVKRKVRRKKYVVCANCRANGVSAAATFLVGSEFIPEKPLCGKCKEKIQAAPVARVGRVRAKSLVFAG